MSRNSGGTYTRITPPGPGGYVGGVGNKIYASNINGEYNDVGAEITDSVSRSGKGAALANLPMGGFKHTNVAQAVANGEYIEYAQYVAEIAALTALINGLDPVGTSKTFYGRTPPTKFIFIPNSPSALLRADYPDLFALLVTNSGYASNTFTVTIASPGVFTKAGHGFTGGELVRLSTTGALPTGLGTTTDYYVLYIDINTFSLSLTDDGAAINTSGSQSGTHSYLQTDWGFGDGSTTFGIPWIGVGESPIQAAYTKNAGKHSDGSVKSHLHPFTQYTGSVIAGSGAGASVSTGSATTTTSANTGATTTNLTAGTYAKWIIKVLS